MNEYNVMNDVWKHVLKVRMKKNYVEM